jgi:DNA polymerase-3 subunit alpha
MTVIKKFSASQPKLIKNYDKKTYRLLQKGETIGIFQLESEGFQRYLKQLKPTELEDIIVW